MNQIATVMDRRCKNQNERTNFMRRIVSIACAACLSAITVSTTMAQVMKDPQQAKSFKGKINKDVGAESFVFESMGRIEDALEVFGGGLRCGGAPPSRPRPAPSRPIACGEDRLRDTCLGLHPVVRDFGGH